MGYNYLLPGYLMKQEHRRKEFLGYDTRHGCHEGHQFRYATWRIQRGRRKNVSILEEAPWMRWYYQYVESVIERTLGAVSASRAGVTRKVH